MIWERIWWGLLHGCFADLIFLFYVGVVMDLEVEFAGWAGY